MKTKPVSVTTLTRQLQAFSRSLRRINAIIGVGRLNPERIVQPSCQEFAQDAMQDLKVAHDSVFAAREKLEEAALPVIAQWLESKYGVANGQYVLLRSESRRGILTLGGTVLAARLDLAPITRDTAIELLLGSAMFNVQDASGKELCTVHSVEEMRIQAPEPWSGASIYMGDIPDFEQDGHCIPVVAVKLFVRPHDVEFRRGYGGFDFVGNS